MMRNVLSVVLILGLASAVHAKLVSLNVPEVLGGEATLAIEVQAQNLGSQLWGINVGGLPNMDEPGDFDNVYFVWDAGADTGYGNQALITEIGWDVCIKTVGTSWLSEAVAVWWNFDGYGVATTPGAGLDYESTTPVVFQMPMTDLVDAGLSYIHLSDGNLYCELAEWFDDYPDEKDSEYACTEDWYLFTVDVVPEPASLSLLALGGLILVGRRRR